MSKWPHLDREEGRFIQACLALWSGQDLPDPAIHDVFLERLPETPYFTINELQALCRMRKHKTSLSQSKCEPSVSRRGIHHRKLS